MRTRLNANRVHIHSPAVQALHKALRKDRPVSLQGHSQLSGGPDRGAKASAKHEAGGRAQLASG